MTGVWVLILVAVHFSPVYGLSVSPARVISQHATEALCESQERDYQAFIQYMQKRGKPGVGQGVKCVFLPVDGAGA